MVLLQLKLMIKSQNQPINQNKNCQAVTITCSLAILDHLNHVCP
jgi:hypothetical protein